MDATYTPPQLFFSAGASTDAPRHDASTPLPTAVGSGALSKPLPPNVQIVTLELLNATAALLRLAHQFGLGEDAALSKPASVDLSALFDPSVLNVVHAAERTLTANRPKEALIATRRENAKWPVDGESHGPPKPHAWRNAPPLRWEVSPVVTLGALEIKTFLLTLKW